MAGNKVYVAVLASFSENGKIIPRRLKWENGKTYTIDRVLDVRPAAALKAGGQGDRYTIEVSGKQSYIFFEHNPNAGNNTGKWFVERKI